jgi:hypothetical protein
MLASMPSITAQRIRLDRDREASHDLNRLLDEPGPGVRAAPHRKYVFGEYPGWKIYRENGGLRARFLRAVAAADVRLAR